MYLTLVNAAPVSEYRAGDMAEKKCRHAVCLCDMEMVRCMGHYQSVIDTDNISHQQCSITGNISVPGLNDLYRNSFEILNTFFSLFPSRLLVHYEDRTSARKFSQQNYTRMFALLIGKNYVTFMPCLRWLDRIFE